MEYDRWNGSENHRFGEFMIESINYFEYQFTNELMEKLRQKNIYMKGSTKEQMEELYSFMKGKNLPKAYIKFMIVMGNGTEGRYMSGDSCFMNEIYDLKQGIVDLLEENESIHISRR